MSLLGQYIHSLEDSSFENVKTYFTTHHCRVVDSGDLYMISIPNDFSVFDNETSEFREAIRCAVGTILKKTTNEIVCFGFPYTQEVKVNDAAPFSGSIVASEYIDGTLIRAFHDGSNWRLSTNGSINAYDSYWISSKSFGELFDAFLCRIYAEPVSFPNSPLTQRLDTACTYEFILMDPSVHLQYSKKSSVYHVGTFSNKTQQYVNYTVDRHIPVPESFTCDSFSQLVEKLASNPDKSGYVFYSSAHKASQLTRCKLLSEEYLKRRQLLGNTPNMYLRYLECKADGTDKDLLTCFPHLRYFSSWVEHCLKSVAKTVHQAYSDKFILKNKTAAIDFYYRPIIYELHGNFMKTQEKVTFQVVYKLLTSYHPKRINFILNGVKLIQTSDFVNPIVEEK